MLSFGSPLRCESGAVTPLVNALVPATAAAGPALGFDLSELSKWKKTFDGLAKLDAAGQAYLDTEAFVNAIAPATDFGKIGRSQYSILFQIADSRKANQVTWDEFLVFQGLLKKPDAEFDIAFKFFDLDGNGAVSFEEFKRVFSENLGPDAIPFNFESDWVKLYLGKVGTEHVLGYNEFTQLMKGLQGERLRQAFRHFDSAETGYITPDNFKRIIIELARHKLSDTVLETLPTLSLLSAGGKISYSECVAFHNVIREMDMVEKVVREACARSPDGKISPEDFSSHASRSMRYGTFSPMEVSIIFHYAGKGTGTRLGLKDFAQLLDPKWGPPKAAKKVESPSGSVLYEVGKSSYYFALGGVAGALGATAVFPIDLVKTRMQNQRSKVVGELLYKNSLDCFKKISKNEGFRGFYRGLVPQLIGVAPEKAIKLTINDLVRGHATDPETGSIALPWEILAGGMAGGCQVIVTNPLEALKIRLQMQGEGGAAASRGAIHIVKQLGLVGLYRGATACLARDVPFSMIYFTSYAHLKKDVFHEGRDGKKLSFGEALLSAGIAGMPAAYLTTPADCIKTRIQSEAKKGETRYKGLGDAFTKILSEEGPRALFKGGIARVVRSSPQFAVTLVAYENFKTNFPYPEAAGSITKLFPVEEDLSRIRARNALKVLLDVHEDFGGVRKSK